MYHFKICLFVSHLAPCLQGSYMLFFLFIGSCGGVIYMGYDSNFYRYISSPNFPYNYPANARCSWRIVTGRYSEAVLDFLQFSTEKGYDKVRITSRYGYNSSVLSGNFSTLNQTTFRFYGELQVEFTSDGVVQSTGFEAALRYGNIAWLQSHLF